jgi:hypothetical protein
LIIHYVEKKGTRGCLQLMEGVKWMVGVVVSLSYTLRKEGGREDKQK